MSICEHRNSKKNFYTFLTIFWICVIFSFSLQSAEKSAQTSGVIVEDISDKLPVEHNTYNNQMQLQILIRKAAHFIEFFILGILVWKTLSDTSTKHILLYCSLICFLVAGCDEAIQLLSVGRESKFTDVVLDVSGAFAGYVGVWLVRNVYRRIKRS